MSENRSVSAIVDGKPYRGIRLPADVEFVGMEVEPNNEPRYGKLYHPWFNLPCYETKRETGV